MRSGCVHPLRTCSSKHAGHSVQERRRSWLVGWFLGACAHPPKLVKKLRETGKITAFVSCLAPSQAGANLTWKLTSKSLSGDEDYREITCCLGAFLRSPPR
jgi:hypothetical protein